MAGVGEKCILVAALVLAAGPSMAQVPDQTLFPAAGGLLATREQPDEIFLRFGAEEADVRKTAEKLWGEPVETGTMEECGAGPMAFAEFGNGMMLHFQDGAFEGWFLQSDGTVETVEGIGIGTTLGKVVELVPGVIEVGETTLGYEFWAEDFFGIVTSPEEDGFVEALWSGASCLFR